MSKFPEIGKEYKEKSTGHIIMFLMYRLGGFSAWNLNKESKVNDKGKNIPEYFNLPNVHDFFDYFEELPDQEPVKEHVKNLYTKEEHVNKKPKSLHEGSIWKPISELSATNDEDYLFFKLKYCTLTDFVNKQESLEQRITDLEKRLISNAYLALKQRIDKIKE